MTRPNKILVADDEQYIVRLIEVNLVRAGYNVVKAYSAAEAVQVALRETPDLIILDAGFPLVDGREARELLREDPRTSDIPVVMLTPKGFTPGPRQMQWGGRDLLLPKPFIPWTLDRVVALLLRRHRMPPSQEWPSGLALPGGFLDPSNPMQQVPGMLPSQERPAGLTPPGKRFGLNRLMAAIYRVLRAIFGRGR